jgi:hypothetical protein
MSRQGGKSVQANQWLVVRGQREARMTPAPQGAHGRHAAKLG